MPETIALADRDVAHLNGEENLQRGLPGLFINLGIDTEGPGGLSPVFDHVRSGADDIGEIEYGVPVVQKLSPRLRSAGLDELPVASEAQLEQPYVPPASSRGSNSSTAHLGCPGWYPTWEMPITGGRRH